MQRGNSQPSGSGSFAYPRVAELLRLPEVLAGAPELVAGASGIDREVRWAHVVAGGSAAWLLDGGELVLTTGAGWPSDPAALETLAHALTHAGAAAHDTQHRRSDGVPAPGEGVAAIVLELGGAFTEAPEALTRACEADGVPLVLLHHEVRFVQITQRIHQRILATHTETLRAQTVALEARQAVHAMLTELALNRSPVDYVVERLAATLDAPVVLEDSAHRVVAAATQGEDLTQTLAPWGAEREPTLPTHSSRVPVEARGTSWGWLTALPGIPHPAGRRTVLELGAFVLALGRLADASGEQWLHLTAKRVFEALLGGRYRGDVELATQLTAAGLPVHDRVILAATMTGIGDFGAHASLERATLETAIRRAIGSAGRALVSGEDLPRATLLMLLSLPDGDARIAATEHRATPALATRLARELDVLVPATTPPTWRVHLALGVAARRPREIVAALEQLRRVGRVSPSSEVGRVTVQQVEQQPLAHLVRALAGVPELQQFTEELLAPIIAHDRVHGSGHAGDLMRVLAAYVAHPGNRSLAAREARLSRSVFYQRIELIEQLLGADLADGEMIAAITVALLAR